MRKMMMAVLVSVMAASGALWAEDAAADKAAQMEKIKALRSGLLHKIPTLDELFDMSHNGWNTAAQSLQAAMQVGQAALAKRLEEENAKPVDARDKAAVDTWNAKVERFQNLWSKYATKDAPALQGKMGAQAYAYRNLSDLVGTLARSDQTWFAAQCDTALLLANFTELDKRADEIKTQGSAALADYLKYCADLERTYKE